MIIIKPTLCTLTREFHCYFAKPLLLLFLTPRPALSSHQHGTLVCLFWSGNLYCTVLTHQGITWLLAKSAFSCWMYPTAQIVLSLIPSHPWVPPEWPYCQQAQWRCWYTVKQCKVVLQTSSHPQNSASHLLVLCTGPTHNRSHLQFKIIILL